MIITTTTALNLRQLYIRFLMVSRFSQDALENLFSIIRAKTPAPRAREFKYTLQLIMLAQFFKSSKHGSYDMDDSVHLTDFLCSRPDLNAELDNAVKMPTLSKNLVREKHESLEYLAGGRPRSALYGVGLPCRPSNVQSTLGCLSMSQKRSIADFFSPSSKRAKHKAVSPELFASTAEYSETLQEQENAQCFVSIPLEETVRSIASDDACPSSSGHMDRECDDLSASCAARHQPDSATEFTASDVDVDHAGQLDISKFKTEQPTQPILNPFPSKKYGKLSRSFNSNWYRLFPWLEYSAQAGAAFCYPCRMSSTGDNEKLHLSMVDTVIGKMP
ncbi:hypothetical protein HPB50_021176 [Hyalomma asiaticum]|uniref:Uncharacterized protein n=1 Tax=Hyalomma asiaticum TaxID=266040 RepID=A0ACB7RYB9_HYAAI|nr:hypothetical protein HPB50_021176 [Hyalomma asiaticum]